MALSVQVLPHQHPRAVQLPLRGAGRDVEHRRDLPVLVALDVVQHEYLPGARWQLLDGRLEIHGQVGARRIANDRLRSMTTFTARRCSQVENCESPRNWPSFCQVRTKMSCVTSSASQLPSIRRVRVWMRATWVR